MNAQIIQGNFGGYERDLAAWIRRLSYLAFGLMLAYVFAILLINYTYGLTEKLKLLGLLGLCWLGWKYSGEKLRQLLGRVRISPIIILALLIRLAWVLSSGVVQTSDFAGYDEDAWKIANGGKWFGVFRTSGAPIFYALHYWIFGHYPLLPQISLALLSTLQVYLVYDLTNRVLGDKNAGKIAALALAFWPEHILYNNLLCTEVPFATLILWSVWLLWSDARWYAGRIFLAGVCLGMATWVRPNAPIFLAAVLAFVMLKKVGATPLWTRTRLALGGLAGFALLTAPIVYLNYRDAGIISAIPSQQSGYNLMFGTSVAERGRWNEADCEILKAELSRRERPPGMNHFVFTNQVAREIGLNRLKTQPLSILYTAVRYKIPELWGLPAGLCWSLETSRLKANYYTICYLAVFYHGVMVALCAWIVLRHGRLFAPLDQRWIYILAVLLATMSHLILEVQGRYHHGYLPILAICIGGYACSLSTRETSNHKIHITLELREAPPDQRQQAA
jgi:hypothetical protein